MPICYNNTPALISGDEHYIPDSSLTSSSVWENAASGPNCFRMVDIKPVSCESFGWAMKLYDNNPWIQVTVNFRIIIKELGLENELINTAYA